MISDPALVQLLSIIPATLLGLASTIAACGALWQGIRNHEKTARLTEKTEIIHNQTNGNLSRVTKQLDSANTKIEELQRLVTNAKIDGLQQIVMEIVKHNTKKGEHGEPGEPGEKGDKGDPGLPGVIS